MDALSDVLRLVRLSGAVYLDGEFTAPWCLINEADRKSCEAYLPRAERVLPFHLITDGACRVRLPDGSGSEVELHAGDLVVVPRGETHVIGSDLGLAPVASAPILARMDKASPGGVMRVRYGGSGEATRMVCGFLAADGVASNPLLASLPRLFRVDMRGADSAWLETSLRFAAHEAAGARAGATTVLGKLSELLFIEAIRRYIDTLSDGDKGWLAAVRDRYVGRALAQMHADPSRAWTVDALARSVGLSRSALAQRFSDLVGSPPMQYLARWRLQLAASELRSNDCALARVAEQIGYDSEAAFNRAFKREFGVPPAAWRRGVRGERPAAAERA